MSKKIVFAADLSKFIEDTKPEVETVPEIEGMVLIEGRIALNIRACYIESRDLIVPNCWFHTISEDGESSEPLMFFPIIDNDKAKFHGGANRTWFNKYCGETWKGLRQQKRAQISATEAVSADINGDETPF